MSDAFGEPMKIREAIALLAYGTNYEIKGSYSGKIYHRSWVNKKGHAEKFYDEIAADDPFYATGRMSAVTGTAFFSPVIGIWMSDYYLCKEQQTEGKSE